MLARTFKTAAELGIPEHEAHALQTVLYMLEDGEIKLESLYMGSWTVTTSCGTTHCIAGWANTVDERAFREIAKDVRIGDYIRLKDRIPTELCLLFGMDNIKMSRAEPGEATESLRHYLETGICNRK
jgi:hypothetical protein